MLKNFKSLALIAIVLFVASLTIIGCGGGGGGTGSSGDSTSIPTSSETGSVEGTIYDENGSPMSGATVSDQSDYLEKTARASTVTDSNGHFKLTGIAVGTRKLAAYKDDYANIFEVNVTPDTTSDAGTVYIFPAGSISGTVVDQNGNTIGGAMLEITVETDPIPTATTTASPNPTTTSTTTPTSTPTSTSTTIPTATPTGSGNIQGVVQAYLTDDAVEGAAITLDNHIGGTATTTTDSSGSFSLSGVDAGIHLLTAEVSGYYSTNATIIVENGVTTYHNFMLYPMSDALSRSKYGMYLYAVSDSNGSFSFQFLPEGTYTVTGYKAGYEQGSAECTVVTGETATVTVVLNGGSSSPTPTATATSTPTSSPSPTPTGRGNVKGKVTRATRDYPVYNAKVMVVGQGIYTYTDSVGKYELDDVWAGTQSIYVEGEDSSTTVEVVVKENKTVTLNIELPLASPSPTASPTPTPTPSATSTSAGEGTLYVKAYGFYDDGEWVGVKRIRVWEYGNYSNRWYNDWSEYAHETSYELTCQYAELNKYYVVEVEWHNGESETNNHNYFYYTGQTIWVERGKLKEQ